MRIEILVVEHCAHERAAASLLRRALDELGPRESAFTVRVVADRQEAERIGFTGSPTFRVDGRDLFAQPASTPALACRLYPTPAGPSGVPTLDQLCRALRAATTRAAPVLQDQTPRGAGAPAAATPCPGLAEAQREHWQRVYAEHPGMYGEQPSAPACHAAELFRAAGAGDVLELGAGHGRDALYFARRGFTVLATDFSATALRQLREAAAAQGLDNRVDAAVHDARTPLPMTDASVDAVFAHMLLCMALTTGQIHTLVAEVRRVLRPGGVFLYTVRHTGDAHYGVGIERGQDIYEHGGFAVHFFPRDLIDELAEGWQLTEVHPFEEGDLPRRLWRVTQTKP